MRYAIPVIDEEVAKARIESVPKKTREDCEYCVRLWKDWAENQNNLTDAVVPPLKELASDSEGLQYWMSRFVMEISTKKETAYNPNSLHHLVCGTMRYICDCLWENPPYRIFCES